MGGLCGPLSWGGMFEKNPKVKEKTSKTLNGIKGSTASCSPLWMPTASNKENNKSGVVAEPKERGGWPQHQTSLVAPWKMGTKGPPKTKIHVAYPIHNPRDNPLVVLADILCHLQKK